jgi:hypothetical protein
MRRHGASVLFILLSAMGGYDDNDRESAALQPKLLMLSLLQFPPPMAFAGDAELLGCVKPVSRPPDNSVAPITC